MSKTAGIPSVINHCDWKIYTVGTSKALWFRGSPQSLPSHLALLNKRPFHQLCIRVDSGRAARMPLAVGLSTGGTHSSWLLCCPMHWAPPPLSPRKKEGSRYPFVSRLGAGSSYCVTRAGCILASWQEEVTCLREVSWPFVSYDRSSLQKAFVWVPLRRYTFSPVGKNPLSFVLNRNGRFV